MVPTAAEQPSPLAPNTAPPNARSGRHLVRLGQQRGASWCNGRDAARLPRYRRHPAAPRRHGGSHGNSGGGTEYRWGGDGGGAPPPSSTPTQPPPTPPMPPPPLVAHRWPTAAGHLPAGSRPPKQPALTWHAASPTPRATRPLACRIGAGSLAVAGRPTRGHHPPAAGHAPPINPSTPAPRPLVAAALKGAASTLPTANATPTPHSAIFTSGALGPSLSAVVTHRRLPRRPRQLWGGPRGWSHLPCRIRPLRRGQPPTIRPSCPARYQTPPCPRPPRPTGGHQQSSPNLACRRRGPPPCGCGGWRRRLRQGRQFGQRRRRRPMRRRAVTGEKVVS